VKNKTLVGIILILFLFSGLTFAQEKAEKAKEEKVKEEKPLIVTFSTYKVPFNQLGDFLKMMGEITLPIIKEIDCVKGYRVFRHYWGPDWTVLIMMEFESMAAIEKFSAKQQEMMAKKYPDKEELEKIQTKFLKMWKGHTDAITVEVPGIRK
jgi:hypothetical protein